MKAEASFFTGRREGEKFLCLMKKTNKSSRLPAFL
jgi:hypothetical protein